MNLASLDLPAILGPQLAALLALIAADVLMGVALALKTGVFDLKKLPDFYLKMIIPYLVGWLALAIIVRFASPVVLGEQYGGLAADGISWFGWLAVIGALGKRIVDNGRALWGEIFPVKELPPTIR